MKWFLFTLCLGIGVSLPAQNAEPVPHEVLCRFYEAYGLTVDTSADLRLYNWIYEWKGVKYKYGGNSKKGVDCSHFVILLLKNVYDKSVSGGSREMYELLKPFTVKDLKQGNLVFFKIKRRKISHVGIYLGNKKFVHASVKSGVIISDLREEYYQKRYFKAVSIGEVN